MRRNLGYPIVDKMMKVIESADISDLTDETRQQVTLLVKNCRPCQLKQSRPCRFVFSIKDPIFGEFSHVLQVDFAKLSNGNVLHIIDVGTKFRNGKLIYKMDAETAWKTLGRCWVDIYWVAPDITHSDGGTNFNSEELRNNAISMGIEVKIAPIKGHERVGIVERSHAQLRAEYDKLLIDLPQIVKEERLSMTFRAINDTPCSDIGIFPTTLVFGVYPKILGAGPRGTMAKRSKIIRECINLVIKLLARRTIRDSTREKSTASVSQMNKARNLPSGHELLVYREKHGWKLYTLVRDNNNNVDVVLPSWKISTFSINVVRPLYAESDEN